MKLDGPSSTTNTSSVDSSITSSTAYTSAASVLHIEQRCFNAWAAPRSAVMGEWLLRAAHGYTKRANSANALRPHAPLSPALLRSIEEWYARQSLPCIFRLSPLAAPEVDALLQAQGYALLDPSWVMQRIARAADAHWQPPTDCTVHITTTVTDAWLEGYSHASHVQPASTALHRTMLQTTAMPCGYAVLIHQQHPVAWALGVLERGAMGIYDVVVAPEARRRGWGSQLMHGLLQWAALQGATHSDLQVLASNHTAIRLYERLGFASVYGYHYRKAPHGLYNSKGA